MIGTWLRRAACAALLAGLAACGTTSSPSDSSAYYRVKEGDTLSRIAQQQGQSVGNLLRWNKLKNANQIESGMLLRVRPPARDDGAENSAAAKPAPKSSGRSSARTGSAAPASAPVRGITLIWPAEGKLLTRYDGNSAKGLTIANSAGTPVVAAAAGTVAYANNGLRGYGNMVIVRHEHDFLTIYAHNGKLLVKQGQRVTQGQRIAEMGDSDARQVALYFELRQNGQLVNPINALPKK